MNQRVSENKERLLQSCGAGPESGNWWFDSLWSTLWIIYTHTSGAAPGHLASARFVSMSETPIRTLAAQEEQTRCFLECTLTSYNLLTCAGIPAKNHSKNGSSALAWHRPGLLLHCGTAHQFEHAKIPIYSLLGRGDQSSEQMVHNKFVPWPNYRSLYDR